MTTTEMYLAPNVLAGVLYPTPTLPQTRWWFADKLARMNLGDTQKLINGLGEKKTITRTVDGWILERES